MMCGGFSKDTAGETAVRKRWMFVLKHKNDWPGATLSQVTFPASRNETMSKRVPAQARQVGERS
jgi:hypothetical protein